MKEIHDKILFLDYDGVVNLPMWIPDGSRCKYNFPHDNSVNDFQACQWISELCEKHGYEIVVSSTWRLHPNYQDCLRNGGLRSTIEILGATPRLLQPRQGMDYVMRGDEVRAYLDEHPEVTHYLIVDDESDFYMYQKDHLIRTNGFYGFSYPEFRKAESMIEDGFDERATDYVPEDDD